MQYLPQLVDLLQSNSPQNNLLVLELALPSFEWDVEKTLKWLLVKRMGLATSKEEVEYFPMGDLVLQFQQEELFDSRPEHFATSYGGGIVYELFKEEESIFKCYGQVLEKDVAIYNFEPALYKAAILEKIELIFPILIKELY